MNRISKYLICMLMIVSSSVMAEQGIEVTGKGSIKVSPDLFTLTVSVKERGRVASKVKQLVDNKSKQVINMFEKQGVSSTDIDSSILRMYPIFEQPAITLNTHEIERKVDSSNQANVPVVHQNKQHPSKIRLFEVGRTITVNFASLTQYDRILDKLVKIGVSHISPVTLGFSNPDAFYERALANAISNAQTKAAKIAQQLGVTVGPILTIRESGYHSPSSYRMEAMVSDRSFNTQTTKRSISAQVVATFQIEP